MRQSKIITASWIGICLYTLHMPFALSQTEATPPVTPPPAPPAAQPASAAPEDIPAQVPVAQPKSNLGKQVAMPEVVIPETRDVVKHAIDSIEDMQLTDEQYEKIKEIYMRRARQRATPYVVPAKPITRTLLVNLDPGVSPPVLRVTRGQLTSIVFSDLNGQPWIIKDVGMNREMFSDGHDGHQNATNEEPTNVLTIEPLEPAAYGNVSVRLKGLSTPVIFVLAAAQQEVDLRVDAKLPGRNPDAIRSVSYTLAPGIDASLVTFLDGVPPKDSRRVKVTGWDGTEAWAYRGSLYLRTTGVVQYPAYFSSARSTSGKAVYRFDSKPASVMLLNNERAITVFIEESLPTDVKDNP